MKKLKRYQYEKYAILCQLSYPGNTQWPGYSMDDFCHKELIDNKGRSSVRILSKEDKKEVIVVFRGSIGTADWLANLVMLPARVKTINEHYYVHWGFKRLLLQPMQLRSEQGSYQPLRELLIQLLEPMVAAGKKISFIGHSSGGSLAVLIADHLERLHAKSVKRVVTFGQPASGGLSFRRKYKLQHKTYRICCDLDIVTFLPPIPYYFWHVGKVLWLHDEQIYENTPSHERLYRSLKSWLLRPITYHYMRKYIRNKELFDKH